MEPTSSLLTGHLTLGILSAAIPAGVLLAHLPGLRRAYPHLRVTIRYGSHDELVGDLIADRVHAALTCEAREHEFLEHVPCGTLALAAVATPAYLARRGVIDRLEKLLVADFVEFSAAMPFLTPWVAATGDPTLVALLARVSPAVSVPSFSDVLDLVTAGVGIGVVPRKLVAASLAAGHLAEVLADRPPPSRALTLVLRKKSARLLTEAVLLEHLKDALPLW